MFLSLLILNVVLFTIVKLYTRLTCAVCKSSKHLVGKVVLVTGGSAGIGFETAKNLAERGAKVIIASRDESKGIEACKKIEQATGNNDIHFKKLDLSSLKSVKEFAKNINETEKRIDVLVNNAGGFIFDKKTTEDGLLLGMQTNYFGPFLLTNLLLPKLKSSAPSRIVNVASILHTRGNINLDDLNLESVKVKQLSDYDIYSNTKLCNILMSNELSRKLKGTGVTSNALHPGAVQSDILKNSNALFTWVSHKVVWLFGKDCWEGAQTQIYLSVAPEVEKVSGRYFVDCKQKYTSIKAQDEGLAKKLWEKSEKLVGLK